MPKLNLKFLIVCALLFFASGFKNCGLTSTSRAYLIDRLATQINEQRKTNSATVRLKDVTDFEWDKIYVFPPYTTVKEIHTALGYDWEEATNTGIEMFDSYNLLVFTRLGKVVGYLKYPLNLGDFRGIYADRKQRGFTPEEAIFKISVEDSGGSSFLVLSPVK